MAKRTMESIVAKLKTIIDNNGPSYLTDEPYGTYCELLESDAVDGKTAAAILHVLVSGIMADIDFCCDAEQASATIQRECSLNKRMADRLAIIFTSLYSDTHREEWKGKDKEGLRRFLKEKFTCTWKGFAVWDAGNGTVDCHYEAEVVLLPTKGIAKDQELTQQLKKNPFMTSDAIHDLFAKRLRKYLDNQFEDYCTCDDYYQPVVEDFGINIEYDLPAWCKENGFEFISLEGNGDDDGYEPKNRKGWY